MGWRCEIRDVDVLKSDEVYTRILGAWGKEV